MGRLTSAATWCGAASVASAVQPHCAANILYGRKMEKPRELSRDGREGSDGWNGLCLYLNREPMALCRMFGPLVTPVVEPV